MTLDDGNEPLDRLTETGLSAARTFTGRLRVDGSRRDGGPALTELHGRFQVAEGLIMTAAAVPHQ